MYDYDVGDSSTSFDEEEESSNANPRDIEGEEMEDEQEGAEILACDCTDCEDPEECECLECEYIGPMYDYGIHRSAYNNDCEGIERYWGRMDEDSKDKRGFDPLHEAIFADAEGAVKFLLKKGIDFTCTEEDESFHGFSDGKSYSSRHPDDPNYVIPWNSTPFHMVAITGNETIGRLLFQYGYCDADVRDAEKTTVLECAIEHEQAWMVYEILENCNVYHDTVDDEPVIQCLYRMDRVLGRKFIRSNIQNFNFWNNFWKWPTNKHGENLLHVVARANDVEMVRLLLQHTKIDVEAREENDLTVLAITIQNQNAQMVKMIRKYRPDINMNTFKDFAYQKVDREAKEQLYDQYVGR